MKGSCTLVPPALLVLTLLAVGTPTGLAQEAAPAAEAPGQPAGEEHGTGTDADPMRHVDEAAAQEWFERGAVALDEGRFEDALEAFERCYELAPIGRRPYILYNLGVVYDRLRMDAEALDAFETYLRLAPDGPKADDARARARILRSRLREGDGNRAGTDPLGEAPASEGGGSGPWLWVAVGGGVAVVGAVLAVVLLSSGGSEAVEADFGGPVLALH